VAARTQETILEEMDAAVPVERARRRGSGKSVVEHPHLFDT